jgi:hypothetical protein
MGFDVMTSINDRNEFCLSGKQINKQAGKEAERGAAFGLVPLRIKLIKTGFATTRCSAPYSL